MGKPEIRLGCQDGMAVAQYLCAQLVIDGQSRLPEGRALAREVRKCGPHSAEVNWMGARSFWSDLLRKVL